MRKLLILMLVISSTFLCAGGIVANKVFAASNDYAPNEINIEVAVDNFEQLSTAINTNKTSKIKITSSVEISEPLFVDYTCDITAEPGVVLTRAQNYLGDIFVLGVDKSGNRAFLNGAGARLGLTNITIDGQNIECNGSILFMYNGSYAELKAGTVIKDCLKTGNERSLVEDKFFKLSYPKNVGGALAIVDRAKLVIDGATIQNCSVNKSSSTKSSYNGGAIYNQGTMIMNSGLITGCEAASGGAIYNYATTFLYGGEISSCHANTNGGAIATPNTQYGNLYVLGTSILNNSAKNGGAFHQNLAGSIVIDNNSLIKGNSATQKGGAIFSRGSIVVRNAIFENNTSNGNGGAIYQEHLLDTDYVTIRFCELRDGAIFKNNSSTSTGEALAVNTSGIIKIMGATFEYDTSDFTIANILVDPETGTVGNLYLYDINLKEELDRTTLFKISSESDLIGNFVDYTKEVA